MKSWLWRWVLCSVGWSVGIPGPSVGAQVRPGPACALEEFRFVGNDADRVSQGSRWEPNEVPDGHFRVTLAAPSAVGIKSITIRASRGGIWSPRIAHHWVLGIYSDGEKVQALEPIELLRFTGEKVLDLYIEPNESRFFASGDEFQVTVCLADDTLLVGHCQVRWEQLAKPAVAQTAHPPLE